MSINILFKVKSKKPKKERLAADFYATPQKLADAIVLRVHGQFGHFSHIIEPSAGSGAFVRSLRVCNTTQDITAVELRGEERQALYDAGADEVITGDWEDKASELAICPALIIGNPPFIKAEQHIRAGLVTFPKGTVVAFLLRLSFLCGQDRVDRMAKLGGFRGIMPIKQRPSFAHGGTDGSEYGVFIWEVGYGGPPHIYPHISWDNGGKKAP